MCSLFGTRHTLAVAAKSRAKSAILWLSLRRIDHLMTKVPPPSACYRCWPYMRFAGVCPDNPGGRSNSHPCAVPPADRSPFTDEMGQVSRQILRTTFRRVFENESNRPISPPQQFLLLEATMAGKQLKTMDVSALLVLRGKIDAILAGIFCP